MSQPTDPLLGRVLGGRYRLERKLGQGGMGAVYAAVHLELARPVALKTLLDVVDARDIDRFRTEALAAASLAHPHIVAVTDFAAPKGDEPAYLVMELLAGHSLARVLGARGALPPPTALHVALQMLDAIGAAHHARILHRDVKPANVVLLDGNDPDRPWVKLVDFGIAKLMDDESRHTTTGALIGTPAYMAPEQLLGHRATERADLYAVGVCLHEMLSGKRPFAGRGGELVSEVLRGDVPALTGVAPELAAVVQRSMHRDAAQRYGSAEEMAAALRAACVPHPPRRPRGPLFVLAAAMGFAVAAAAGAAAVLSTASSPPAPTAEAGEPDAPDDVRPEDVQVEAASTPTPSSAASADAARRPTPEGARILSYCADVRGEPLCERLVARCYCRSGAAAVFESADASSPWIAVETSEKAKKDGQACHGFVRLYKPSGEPFLQEVDGKLVCDNPSCGFAEKNQSLKLAVPGTPCSGYLVPGPAEKGTWRAVKR